MLLVLCGTLRCEARRSQDGVNELKHHPHMFLGALLTIDGSIVLDAPRNMLNAALHTCRLSTMAPHTPSRSDDPSEFERAYSRLVDGAKHAEPRGLSTGLKEVDRVN